MLLAFVATWHTLDHAQMAANEHYHQQILKLFEQIKHIKKHKQEHRM